MIDKSEWGDGPWQHEPDRVDWCDEETGFHCQILRHERWGHLNGYVIVPKDHPTYGCSYSVWRGEDDPPLSAAQEFVNDIRVHGGLTYAAQTYAAQETEHTWKFGFDCAHAWDVSPGLAMDRRPIKDEVYRDLAYVKGQVLELARQLVTLGRPDYFNTEDNRRVVDAIESEVAGAAPVQRGKGNEDVL